LSVFKFVSGISNYIALSSNGQLNVWGEEEDLFRAWGSSEFRDLTPNTVFQELEDRIIKVQYTRIEERLFL